MSEGLLIAVIPALITSCLTFAGVLVTSSNNNKKLENNLKTENTKVLNEFRLEVTKNQAITDTKIAELTREVREHNNFARRIPVVENEIEHLKDLHK